MSVEIDSLGIKTWVSEKLGLRIPHCPPVWNFYDDGDPKQQRLNIDGLGECWEVGRETLSLLWNSNCQRRDSVLCFTRSRRGKVNTNGTPQTSISPSD